LRGAVVLFGMLASASAFAFSPIPKESAKVLKVTRGRPFSSGVVFVNGKYLEPPYVVERWGTGIRINGFPVSGQIIDWNEFLKTQKGAKAVRREPQDAPPTASAAAAAADVDEKSLDDLFDDDSAEKGKTEVRKAPAAAKPMQKVTYELEGEFVPTDATKAMLAKINAFRTEIDRSLRSGEFICFGDTYSLVRGDSRTLMDLLEKLPEIQRSALDEKDFSQRVRAAGMVYLSEVLRQDLYRNRVDYRKLQERRIKLKKDGEVQKLLNRVSAPLL